MNKPIVTQEIRLKIRERLDEIVFMHHNWRDLLFISWEFNPEEIQNHLPSGLFVDTYKGRAYVSIIPFTMQDITLSPLSIFSSSLHFAELNLRTYVYDENGIPGVWFFSLDLDSRIGVFIANKFFSLPYVLAQFEVKHENDQIGFQGQRLPKHEPLIDLNYQPNDSSFLAEVGSLDFFLVERYALYTNHRNQLHRGQIHHAPYQLSKVNINKFENQLFELNGLQTPGRNADHIIYSKGVDVDFYKLNKCRH